MQSRPRVPEEPHATPRPRPIVTAGGTDAELAAVALLCLVFAWTAEEPDKARPRSDSR